MKIDTTNIDGYAEMTPEQKLAALEAFEYDDHAEELEQLRNSKTKANAEAAEWKRKHNERLTEEERAAAERDAKWAEMEAKLAALEREKLESTYKASYLALGYDDALATETAKAMAEGNTAKVFENQKKAAEAAEKRIKADLMKNNPHPGGAGGGDGKTEDAGVELARKLGKAKADAQKDSNDILKNYL